MKITIDLVLFFVAIILMILLIIKPTRLWLVDQENIINVCVAIIGLIVAVWFGFSADQLSKEANKLASVSKSISQNSYYYYTIESDSKKPNERPYIDQKSGLYRSLFVLLKSQDFETEEPIRVGVRETRDGVESFSEKDKTVTFIGRPQQSERDFFTTESFYYYFVVGEGLNNKVQVETVVFFIDNIKNSDTINKNSEFFTAMSKDDLINKKSVANMYARNYLTDKGEELTEENVGRISKEINSILDKYEEIQEHVKQIY
ncbi:hypothetical protein [Enterococcus sp. AZ196]|uniref:hypothetical protein n=1 Tax=Enterococcus sp. AZ196 TaxID=2774659 RepID=UPI003D2DF64C